MILDLKIFYGEEKNIIKWRGNLNNTLIEMISDGSVGYSIKNIDCRESLYNMLKRAISFNRVASVKNKNKMKIKIKLNDGKNYSETRSFLATSIFGEYLNFSNNGWLINRSYTGCPVIYSTTALVVNKYLGYYEPKNPNNIPLRILEEINKGIRSIYVTDYIYTAFFIYILLNPEYKWFSKKYFKYSELSSANGPGSEIYKHYRNIYNVSNRNGGSISYNWWQKKEVKELLEQIMKNTAFVPVEKKILRTFMEK